MKKIKLLTPSFIESTSTTTVIGERLNIETKYFKFFLLKRENYYLVVDIFGNVGIYESKSKESAINRFKHLYNGMLNTKNEKEFFIETLQQTKERLLYSIRVFKDDLLPYVLQKDIPKVKKTINQIVLLDEYLSYYLESLNN